MTYEETPDKKYKQTKKKETSKMSKPEKAKEDYTKARATHKIAIKELKGSIKKHKLLMKQAKTVYKLSKLG